MAKSSINILKNCAGFSHNDRSEKKQPEYLLPLKFRKKNEFDRKADEAKNLLDEYIQEAKENYKKETGQRFQGRVLYFEAAVNVNENHTLEDIKKLNERIEKEFGFRAVQSAIHRDEGHLSDDGERAIYNYHCHIVFCNLDKNGKTLLKNMTKADFTRLQDITAETLQMERGRPAKETKAKHKHHTVFRAEAERERAERKNEELKKELAKAKDLQEINKQLREDLKEAGASREDYAKLEQLNRELKEQIKAKDLTINELNIKIDEYKQSKAPKTNENILNDKSMEEEKKIVYRALKDDFFYETDLTEKGLIKKTHSMKLKEEFSEPPQIEQLSLFNRVKNKLFKAYDIIKEQAIKILNLETENQELKEKVKDLQIKVSTQQKQLSKEKLEHSSLNSEKKEISIPGQDVKLDISQAMNEIREETKKPFIPKSQNTKTIRTSNGTKTVEVDNGMSI